MSTRLTTITALLIALTILPTLARPAGADDASDDAAKAEQRALFRQGARLWPDTCGACHKARPAGERSPAEWDTIMLHMRVRANLPGQHARAILQFLKSR